MQVQYFFKLTADQKSIVAGRRCLIVKDQQRPLRQYGPGTLAQCHAVDEYVDVQQYYDAILVYAELILRWTGLS